MSEEDGAVKKVSKDRHLLFAPRHDFFSLDAGALKR